MKCPAQGLTASKWPAVLQSHGPNHWARQPLLEATKEMEHRAETAKLPLHGAVGLPMGVGCAASKSP